MKSLIFLFFTLLIVALTGTKIASAATLTVSDTCSLKNAISYMSSGVTTSNCPNSGEAFGINDTIKIPDGTYCLSETVTISTSLTTDLTITGSGATILDGGNDATTGTGCTTPSDSKIFSIAMDTDGQKLTLKNLTIQGGTDPKGAGLYINCKQSCDVELDNLVVQNNLAENASALYFLNSVPSAAAVSSNISITDSQFLNNTTIGTDNVQGGIVSIVDTSSYLQASLNHVLIDSNTIDAPSINGGAFYFSGTSLSIERSAITRNTSVCGISTGSANCNGGGTLVVLYGTSQDFSLVNSSIGENSLTGSSTTDYVNGAGLFISSGDSKISYSTIAYNTANSSATTLGGGIYLSSDANLEWKGLLLANNTASATTRAAGADCYNDGAGTITSQGYNWIEDDSSCSFTPYSTLDKTGTAPTLATGAFANNGGETYTLALSSTGSSSNPKNKGGATCTDLSGLTLSQDQRGATRSITTGDCDIGAYEQGARETGSSACLDEIDNDGDGATDCSDSDCSAGCTTSYYKDDDNDGYGDASDTTGELLYGLKEGYSTNNTDCDDSKASVKPGATETCNDVDDNCDDTIDNDATDTTTFYQDNDDDGYGDPSSAFISACDSPGTFYAPSNDDCDDNNSNSHPGASEMCDELDNDCDEAIDEDFSTGAACSAGLGECKADGTLVCKTATETECSATAGTPVAEDCSNSLDDDCDGLTDTDDTTDCSSTTCTPVAEICSNDIDDDCDGLIDASDASDCPGSHGGSGGGSGGSGSGSGSGSSGSGSGGNASGSTDSPAGSDGNAGDSNSGDGSNSGSTSSGGGGCALITTNLTQGWQGQYLLLAMGLLAFSRRFIKSTKK